MAGREQPFAAAMLRTQDLTIRFGGLTALNSVNFEVRQGEIRAIIGPNGAGKSTFFNCLTGVLRPSSGHILFNGGDITGANTVRLWKGITHRVEGCRYRGSSLGCTVIIIICAYPAVFR